MINDKWQMSNGFVDATRDVQKVADAAESIILDLLAATAPWLAPLFPAYIAFTHISDVLRMPFWLAVVGGIVIEALGLTTIHTTFQFWHYNANPQHPKGGETNEWKAPVLPAALAGVFYLTIVITVNVLLDNSVFIERLAKALLSLISVVAAVTLALRAQHKRRLLDAAERERQLKGEAERERERAAAEREQLRLEQLEERRAKRDGKREFELKLQELEIEKMKVVKVSESFQKVPETSESKTTLPKDWRRLTPEQKIIAMNMTPEEIAKAAGVTVKTGQNWLRGLSGEREALVTLQVGEQNEKS